MFHKAVREAHFTYLKNKLSGMNFLPKEFHDPTLEFKTRLHRYITEQNKISNLSTSPWLGILWTRSNIEEPQVLTEVRRFKVIKDTTTNPDEPKGEKYNLRLASTKMSLAIYSNDIDYLETAEEYLYLLVQPHHVINVIYSSLTNNPFKILVNNFKRTSFTKEERENFGTLARLNLEYDLVYPIIKLQNTIKFAKEITFSIKLNDIDSDIEV